MGKRVKTTAQNATRRAHVRFKEDAPKVIDMRSEVVKKLAHSDKRLNPEVISEGVREVMRSYGFDPQYHKSIGQYLREYVRALINGPGPRKAKRPEKGERVKFLDSQEWLTLRYQILLRYGRQCMCCGTSEGEIHVDHIKPRSKYPELALDPENLQVLCRACNLGKLAWDETDFRPKEA